jgi:hypothetical protein
MSVRDRLARLAVCTIVGAVPVAVAGGNPAGADTAGPIGFEGYSTGSIDGQDGWSSSGVAGSGCAVYDHKVSDNSLLAGVPVSFGSKSLRISNAVTSGCFGDQTYSKKTVDDAGEAAAAGGTFTSGVRQNDFSASFDVASAAPTAEQPGLGVTVSPDRGDGARMSWVRFEDSPTGINVLFNDFVDAAPFGSASNLAAGCDTEDAFRQTTIATGLSRTSAHNVKIRMRFVPGPRNDVVRVWVDGTLVHTGTSWEDYFRYCEETDTSRTVRSLLFRTGGPAAPATLGKGFSSTTSR